jgi:hypothetical protein
VEGLAREGGRPRGFRGAGSGSGSCGGGGIGPGRERERVAAGRHVQQLAEARLADRSTACQAAEGTRKGRAQGVRDRAPPKRGRAGARACARASPCPSRARAHTRLAVRVVVARRELVAVPQPRDVERRNERGGGSVRVPQGQQLQEELVAPQRLAQHGAVLRRPRRARRGRADVSGRQEAAWARARSSGGLGSRRVGAARRAALGGVAARKK